MLFALLLFATHFVGLSQSELFSLRGRIVVPSGVQTPPIATVRLVGANEETIARSTAGAAGTFEFHGVRRGSYYIQVDIPGYPETRRAIDLPAYSGLINVYVQPPPVVFKDPNIDALGGGHTVNVRQLTAGISKKAIREYEKGLEEGRKRRLDRAIAHFEKAISLAPDFYNAHWRLGMIYSELKRHEEAKREFIWASELDKHGGEPLIGLGEIYLREESWKEAAAVLEQAVRLTPGSAAAAYYLGSVMYKLKEYTQAEQHLLRARFLKQDFQPVSLMLINVYLRQSRLKDALSEVEKHLELNPDAPNSDELSSLRERLIKDLSRLD